MQRALAGLSAVRPGLKRHPFAAGPPNRDGVLCTLETCGEPVSRDISLQGVGAIGSIQLAHLPQVGRLLVDPHSPGAPGRLVVKRRVRQRDGASVETVYVPSDEEDLGPADT